MRVRRTVFVAFVALVLVTGVAAPARADGIGDKQGQAAAIAARINSLQDQIAQLGEGYDQAILQSSQLDQQVRDAEARLAGRDTQLGSLKKQMASFALSRYTSNTDPNSFSTLAAGPSLADGAVQRAGYAELALGTNRDVSDQLKAAVQDTQHERDSLAAKRDRQSQLAQLASQKKKAAEDASAQLDSTLRSVRADLAVWVQQEQERQAAEAARQQQIKIAAEAKKAADQAAEQNAAAAAATARATQASKNTAPKGSGVGQAVPAPTITKNDSTGSTGTTSAPRASQPAPAIPGTSAGASVAVRAALSQLGVPYRFGQSVPGVAFDCSGLTMYAWGRAGVSLPHSAQAQYDMLPHVPLSALQPGDLIFAYTPVSHVGIYVGNGQMVAAPRTGDVVKVSSVSPNAVGAGRPG